MMKRFSFIRLFSVVLVLLLATTLVASIISCTTRTEATDKIGVVVTIPPQAEFVESVGREKVAVAIMVPSGASPHTYEPTPGQMRDLARAKMYAKVGSGVEFELVWMDKLIAANKNMLVIDCSKDIELQEMTEEHGQEGEHKQYSTMDPHIWMSPLNAKIMVQNICNGLIQLDPNNRTYYEQNRDAYFQRLTKLDQNIRDGLSEVTNRVFMVYHPSFGYFAKEYDLTLLPIEKEGKEPTAAGITHLIEQAKEHNIKVVFASPQFNPQSAKVIADAIGGRVVFIDSLAREYVMNLRILLGELVQAIE